MAPCGNLPLRVKDLANYLRSTRKTAARHYRMYQTILGLKRSQKFTVSELAKVDDRTVSDVWNLIFP